MNWDDTLWIDTSHEYYNSWKYEDHSISLKDSTSQKPSHFPYFWWDLRWLVYKNGGKMAWCTKIQEWDQKFQIPQLQVNITPDSDGVRQ